MENREGRRRQFVAPTTKTAPSHGARGSLAEVRNNRQQCDITMTTDSPTSSPDKRGNRMFQVDVEGSELKFKSPMFLMINWSISSSTEYSSGTLWIIEEDETLRETDD